MTDENDGDNEQDTDDTDDTDDTEHYQAPDNAYNQNAQSGAVSQLLGILKSSYATGYVTNSQPQYQHLMSKMIKQ